MGNENMPKQVSKELTRVIIQPMLTGEEEIAIREALGTSFELEFTSAEWRGIPGFALIITMIVEAIAPSIAEDAWKALKRAIKKISGSRKSREKSRLEFRWENKGINATFEININDKKGEQLFMAIPEIINGIAKSLEVVN